MHSFALREPRIPAIAIAAHAQAPDSRSSAGTDLLGLMKDRAALPERLLDINGLPRYARSRVGRRGPGHRRAGPDERRGSGRGGAPTLSRHRRGVAVCRIRPTPQQASMGAISCSDPLRLLPRQDDLPCTSGGRDPAARPSTGSSQHAIFGWSTPARHEPSDVAVALAA